MTRADYWAGGLGTVSSAAELWCLDPDVDALFDDIDAILGEALSLRPCRPPLQSTISGTRPRPAPGPVSPADAPRKRYPVRGHDGLATQRAPPAHAGPPRGQPNVLSHNIIRDT